MKMRRVIAIILTVILTISMLSACGEKSEDTQAKGQNGSGAIGRYMETEIALPEEGQRVLDIQNLDDGTIGALVTNNKDTMTLWSSSDMGTTWEQQYQLSLDNKKEEYIANATLAADKTLLAIVYSNELSETAMSGIIWGIDADGNKSEININLPESESAEGVGSTQHMVIGGDEEDGEMPEGNFNFEENTMQDAIWELRVGANKEVLANTVMGRLFSVDIKAGEVLREYEMSEEEFIMSYAIVNGDVYIGTGTGLKCYDLETGDIKEVRESLVAKVTSDTDSMETMQMMQGGFTLAAKSGETDAVYLVDNTGIYRQSEDGTVLEQVVEASLTSLSMPNIAIRKMVALSDDSFVVFVEGGDGESKLYRYAYDAEAKTVPEKEINIYALTDNIEVRQAIAMYQKENPGVVVSMQIGMTEEMGITVSDALNTLNTEIMAGNGPDILVLDGMPIESYSEKGILENISDVVNQIAEQDGIMEKVKNNYAIASRFSVPYVQGVQQYVEQIKDIGTLKEVSQEIKKDNPDDNTINGTVVKELMNYLYKIDVSNFITAEGTLEKEKMQNFLVNAKAIADDNRSRKDAIEELEDTSIVMSAALSQGYDVLSVVMDLLMYPKSLGRGEIRSINNLATVLELNKKENMPYGLFADDQGNNLLLTNTILGINSKSESMVEAKEFLAFCLSKEAQMSDQGLGLPVNMAALSETLHKEIEEMHFGMATEDEEGVMTTTEFSVKKPDKTDVETFENEISGDTRIGYSNNIVQDIIMEQLMGYVEGRTTLEAAVGEIDQKVSLYLAE